MKIDAIFDHFKRMPFSDFPKLQSMWLNSILPKNSKALTTNLMKDIGGVEEPRLLVITIHLYFDYILQKMLDKESHNLSKRQQESFYAKLEFLKDIGRIDPKIYSCLFALNRLRNSFAHDIFYRITDWDPKTIPFVQTHQLRIPKVKKFLKSFNMLLLRVSFLVVLADLLDQYDWLYLENVRKK
jgi:hypothetical protein